MQILSEASIYLRQILLFRLGSRIFLFLGFHNIIDVKIPIKINPVMPTIKLLSLV